MESVEYEVSRRLVFIWTIELVVTRKSSRIDEHIRLDYSNEQDADAVFRHVCAELEGQSLLPESETVQLINTRFSKLTESHASVNKTV
jgi:hypothetical protein